MNPQRIIARLRDPAIHEAAARIAGRCVTIIDAFLPPGTRSAVEDEFYKAARIELDRLGIPGDASSIAAGRREGGQSQITPLERRIV